MRVPALIDLAVSLYVPEFTGPATYHRDARQTNYLAAGNAAGATTGEAFTQTVARWFFLDAAYRRRPGLPPVIPLRSALSSSLPCHRGTASVPPGHARWRRHVCRCGLTILPAPLAANDR